jgi:hypothetical protein
VYLEAVEAADGALPFLGDSLEGLVLLFPLDLTCPQGVESMKDIPVHLPRHTILTKMAMGTPTLRWSPTNR